MIRRHLTVGLLFLLLFIGLGLFTAIVARADEPTVTTIQWGGHGSENLPCADGEHWVLAPAFGIDSATLFIADGQSVLESEVMVQNGNGSWAADTSVDVPPIPPGAVWVEYTGPGDERDHLQLSHCLEGESPSPTVTPSPSSSPSETPSPSDTPSPSGSSSTTTPPPSSHTTTPPSTRTHRPSSAPPRKTAFTGFNGKAAAGAVILLLTGLGALWYARRLGGDQG